MIPQVNLTSVMLTLALVVAGCGQKIEEIETELHSDSGIRGPAYSTLVSTFKDLTGKHAGIAKLIPYGQSAQGRELLMLRLGNPQASGPRPAIYFGATIHGDEFLGIEDKMPQWFLENRTTSPGVKKFFDAGGILYLVPIINPDGYDNRTRGNTTGQDLNRDYNGKEEGIANNFRNPETKNLVDALHADVTASGAQVRMTMDYHCCLGAFIYPWAHKRTRLPEPDLGEHKALAQKMAGYLGTNYRSGQVPDLVGYLASGSSSDYYYETFGARAFTFEGAEGTEVRNFAKHTTMWEGLLGMYAEGGNDGENPLRMAVTADYGNGSLLVKLSAKRAESMEVCLGNKTVCTGATAPLASTSTKTQVGDRLIFTMTQTISISDAAPTVTLIARDQEKRVIGQQSVRITRH